MSHKLPKKLAFELMLEDIEAALEILEADNGEIQLSDVHELIMREQNGMTTQVIIWTASQCGYVVFKHGVRWNIMTPTAYDSWLAVNDIPF